MAARTRGLLQLFVRKIPFTAGPRELREYFGQFGRVTNCSIDLDKKTGFYQDYGWITFFKEESAQTALDKEDHVLNGYKITVHPANRKDEDDGV